ncbi:hypothetical protein [Limisphaera sp. VF-2]|jgi:hypothetical protein|uniref:hypothetical protein n=1 Tax=Limisphaera sp. VF-2 TaxID=3400418 RepID=UPI001770AC43
MNRLWGILLMIGLVWVGYRLTVVWEERQQRRAATAAKPAHVDPRSLSGLPPQWEDSLAAAQKAGINSFRQWLDIYGPYVQDPRKAWIELDYCVLVARSDPKEARRVFERVRQRVGTNSPVYPYLKALEPTYGQ